MCARHRMTLQTASRRLATGSSSSILNNNSRKRCIQTLTINAGSTTLKYALYDVKNNKTAPALLASGLVDRVGKEDVSITHNKQVQAVDAGSIRNHAEALRRFYPTPTTIRLSALVIAWCTGEVSLVNPPLLLTK